MAIFSHKWRQLNWRMLSVAGILAMVLGGHDAVAQGGGVAGAAALEAQKRQHLVKSAQTLFTAGAAAFADQSYGEAMDNFKAAFETMPDVPAVRDQRSIFFKRYQAASLAYTNQMIDEARWGDAELTLETVMETARKGAIPVNSLDPAVRTILGDLKSQDDRYNQAMSPQHLRNVEAVEAKLILAKGYLELGDFDRADYAYNEVLNIDPYNTAARRGQEDVERHRMNYYDAAYDHTRSKALREVAAGWEMPVVQYHTGTADALASEAEVAIGGSPLIEAKLNNIIIPSLEFTDARLVDVVEFLSQKSQELDSTATDPSQRGVNIVIDSAGALGGQDLSQLPLTVKLTNIPLADALKYVTQQVGMKYRIDSYAVFVVPASAVDDKRIVTRTYSVPPGFLSAGGQGAAAEVSSDPFATPAPTQGIQIKRITAREFLESSGVAFGPGTSANYVATTSTLVVTNTEEEHATVQNLIQASRDSGSKMVKVNVKMVSIEEEGLRLLGLDWLLGASNVGSGTPRTFFGGGTDGNAENPTLPQDYPFVNPATNIPVGMNPVTAGLRMGDLSTGQTIEDVINRNSPEASSNKAPGVFAVSGVFTDPQFQVVLRALNQHKASDMMCDAHVFVKPGQIASIEQVREFIYPTEYDPPEIPQNFGQGIPLGNGVRLVGPESGLFPATPAQPTAFETRNLGKVVEVEPTVSTDNLAVNLNVSTDFSDFVGFINYGIPITNARFPLPDGSPSVVTANEILMPVFDSVRETTNVTVWDGNTIAIGGFHGESITRSNDKVPVIGDLPVIGRAFRSSSSNANKRALIIFVSVLLVDPGGKPINAVEEEPDLMTQREPRNTTSSGAPLPNMVYPAK